MPRVLPIVDTAVLETRLNALKKEETDKKALLRRLRKAEARSHKSVAAAQAGALALLRHADGAAESAKVFLQQHWRVGVRHDAEAILKAACTMYETEKSGTLHSETPEEEPCPQTRTSMRIKQCKRENKLVEWITEQNVTLGIAPDSRNLVQQASDWGLTNPAWKNTRRSTKQWMYRWRKKWRIRLGKIHCRAKVPDAVMRKKARGGYHRSTVSFRPGEGFGRPGAASLSETRGHLAAPKPEPPRLMYPKTGSTMRSLFFS
jgi:hypothetical protein